MERYPQDSSGDEIDPRIAEAMLKQDDVWLSQLLPVGTEIDTPWLTETNNLIEIAGMELQDGGYELVNGRKRVVDARSALFERLNLQAASEKIAVVNPYLVSSTNLVSICRLLAMHGIDLRRASTYPEVLTLSPKSIGEKIQAFIDIGLDPAVAFNAMPSLFGAPAGKAEKIVRISGALGWKGDISELVARGIGRDSAGKLFFMAHLASNHLLSSARNMSPERVIRATRLSPESHLMAVIEDETYEPSRGRHFSDITQGRDRRELLLNALRIPRNCRKVGAQTLRAYFRYKPLTDPEKRRYRGLATRLQQGFGEYYDKMSGRDAFLDEQDSGWLNRVAGTGIIVDETLIDTLNDAVWLGSRTAHFNKFRSPNPTIKARYDFIDALGWRGDGHPLQKRLHAFLNRASYGVSPDAIVRAMRFSQSHDIDPIKFLLNHPSLAPADISPYPARLTALRDVFHTAQRGADAKSLTITFFEGLLRSESELKNLVAVTNVYQSRSNEPMLNGSLWELFGAPVEAHILAICRDRSSNPRNALRYARSLSKVELVDELKGYLASRGVETTDVRNAGLALLTAEC